MLQLEKLNHAQREAVTDASGRDLMVIAGPGSGKTFTITQRSFFLIHTLHIPPEKILVVTFTKDAAMSMQERFFKEADQNYPVNFGTFHSVFYHILRQSTGAPRTELLTDNQKRKLIIPILYKIMEERDQAVFDAKNQMADALPVQKIIKNDVLKDRESVAEAAGQFLSAFSYYKNTNDQNKARGKIPEEWRDYFDRCFREFELERKKEGLLDFDDMVRECRLLFERDHVAGEMWRNRFSHILIDEFQDINPEQYQAVRLLKGEKTCLFAVGDDDQAIYGFRGASPDCMDRFVKEFHAKKICLTVNYRSIHEIVEASSRVIRENRKRFQKELAAAGEEKNYRIGSLLKPLKIWNTEDIRNNREKRNLQEKWNSQEKWNLQEKRNTRKTLDTRETENWKQGGRVDEVQDGVFLNAFEDHEEEYGYLIKKLQETGNHLSSHTTAVLFRTNLQMQGLAAKLNKLGIDFVMKEKVTSIYEHFIAKDLFAYLRIAFGEDRRELYLQIINKPMRYIGREAFSEAVEEKDGQGYAGNDNFEFMEQKYHVQSGLKNRKNRSGDFRILDQVRNFYLEKDWVPYKKERLDALGQLKKDLEAAGGMSLALALKYIVKRVGYERYLKNRAGGDPDKLQEWQQIVEWLSEDAKSYGDIREWEETVKQYKEKLRQSGKEQEGKEQEGNKGLEKRGKDEAGRDGKGQGGRQPVREPKGHNNGENGQDPADGEAAGRTKEKACTLYLMTVHASKGLEFDSVFIPDCSEKVYPHGRMQDTETVEEERRIFYVAMTRARRHLELLYVSGQAGRGGMPSRFLNPLIK